MNLTLEQLDTLAKTLGFSGAHNAITCADIYRGAYSEHMHRSEELYKLIIGLKMLLPKEFVVILDEKLKELEPMTYNFENLFRNDEEKENS